MTAARRPEIASYRLQLRGNITFERARDLVPYLQMLGVDTLYASPFLQAREGSTHGYDTTVATQLDPAIGSRDAFDGLVKEAHQGGIGLLLDIVPNHMAASTDNPWWRNVLEHGRASPFADYFEVRWSADPEHRVVLPLLGRHYGFALEEGEIVPGRDAQGLVVRHHEHVIPLDPASWAHVFETAAAQEGADSPFAALASACRRLPDRWSTEASQCELRTQESAAIRQRLSAITANPAHDRVLSTALDELAGSPGHPRSFDALHDILDAQAYRLTYWRSGLGELNYRRFFDIAELVALRADDPAVLESTHRLVFELIESGAAIGLRVDHIDGLADPATYLQRLRKRGVSYLLVEKILTGNEALHPKWPVDGTTGYEFLRVVTMALTDPAGFRDLDAAFRSAAPQLGTFEDCVTASKREVLLELFSPGLERLARDLRKLTSLDRKGRDVSLAELRRALECLLATFPVYRTYLGSREGASERDLETLRYAVNRARDQLDREDWVALDFIERLVVGDLWPPPDDSVRARLSAWTRRFEQFSGPVMAKGLEDTALYRYVPLLAVNDVGCHPPVAEHAVSAFHAFNQERVHTQPRGLSATATHDTKRGEDVRARLAVLSELAGEWLEASSRWKREIVATTGETDADEAELELLLQTFVGAWPLDPHEHDDFAPRLQAYVLKAAREARLHTSWLRPHEAHEQRLAKRVHVLTAAARGPGWGREVMQFQARIAFHGAINGLTQLTLKLASPGIPDFFQGTDLWDLSLVDPDNRRPVDFSRREALLSDLRHRWCNEPGELIADKLREWPDGGVKLLTLWSGLSSRRRCPSLYTEGAYHPLIVRGRHHSCLCAFARQFQDSWALIVVPRLTTRLVAPPQWPLGADLWDDTQVVLPAHAPQAWRNTTDEREVTALGGKLRVGDVLQQWPVGWLVPA